MKRPRVRTVLAVLEHLIVAAVLVGLGLLLTAGQWLQTTDSPVRADALVVLGGNFSRPAYAAELYQLGMVEKVFISRVYRTKSERVLDQNLIDYPRQEEVYKAVLRKKGVPANAIEYYGNELLSTSQEAETLAAQISAKPGTLLVVTSPYHVLRARMVFKDSFPEWDVRVVSTPLESFPTAWWTDQEAARQVLLELPKIAFYLLGGKFRSNLSSQ